MWATNPERTLIQKHLSDFFLLLKHQHMKNHRRRGRGFTLKCTASTLGGKLDDSGKLIPGAIRHEHAKVRTPSSYTCARGKCFRGGMALHKSSVRLFKASVWNHEQQRHVSHKRTKKTLQKTSSQINRMKIRIIYIKDRENMIKFTSQIVSGYTSYIHLCIHKDMYSGHLEELFTQRSKVIVH